MADVEHSLLTGSSLHEPKGAAAAAANRVYVSDGVGSGAWSQLPAAALASAANIFGGQLLHVRDEQTSGTAGPTLTSGAWRTHTLNIAPTNEITSAALASNQISLPSGVYYAEGYATAYQAVGQAQLRLYNVTDSSSLKIGMNYYGRANDSLSEPGGAILQVRGRFTLSGTKSIELQYRVSTTRAGMTGTSWGTEVYADLAIWKIS